MAVRIVAGAGGNTVPNTTIQSFSDEVMIDILKYLPRAALFEASQVCRRWSALTQDPTTLIPFVRTKEDVDWLRALPQKDPNKIFKHLQPRFDAVPASDNPAEERSVLLRELLKKERIDDRGYLFGGWEFSIWTFRTALREGNTRVAKLLLPLEIPRYTSPFAYCAVDAAPDFARWVASLDYAASFGLPPYEKTHLTTIKIYAPQFGPEVKLYLNGESLYERFEIDRNFESFDSGSEDWAVVLPLKCQVKKTASGGEVHYWETVLLGKPDITGGIEFCFFRYANETWFESDHYIMNIGDNLEFTPSFPPSNLEQ